MRYTEYHAGVPVIKKQYYTEAASKLAHFEDAEAEQDPVNKYDGEDKICNDLTFTLNYSDGTKALVDRGILFSLGDDDRMYIHLGVSKAWEVFGVARCLNDFIKICGMEDLFEKYLRAMEAEDKGRRTRT